MKLKDLAHDIFRPGTFVRNVFIASSWNFAILAVQVALSPIITRIYSPEQYGIFSVYSSVVIMLSLLGSLKYNEAIVLAKSRDERDHVALLSILLTCIIAFFSFWFIFVYNQVTSFFDKIGLEYFIYLIPLGVFLTGFLDVLVCVNSWRRKFFVNGLAGFATNLVSRTVTIAFGQISAQPVVLIGGDLMGKISGCLSIIYDFPHLFSRGFAFLKSITYQSLRVVAQRYQHFPLYVLPSSLIVTFSSHLPIYFFQSEYSSAEVGAYALATSLLEIVNRLIPYSIAGVFFSQAVRLRDKSRDELSRSTYKLFKVLVTSAVVIFLLCAVLSPYVFPVVFGDSWHLAGVFSAILSISYATNFINTSIVEVYKVINKQRALLITSFLSLLLKVAALCFLVFFNRSPKEGLFIFCIASALANWVQIIVVFVKLNYKIWNVMGYLTILEAVMISIVYLTNFL